MNLKVRRLLCLYVHCSGHVLQVIGSQAFDVEFWPRTKFPFLNSFPFINSFLPCIDFVDIFFAAIFLSSVIVMHPRNLQHREDLEKYLLCNSYAPQKFIAQRISQADLEKYLPCMYITDTTDTSTRERCCAILI